MNYYLSKLTPHKIFPVAALFWGLVMLFLVPPYQVPDEPAHFYRAYQVAQFDFMPKVKNNRLGGELPASLQNFYHEIMVTPGNEDDKLTIGMLEAASKIKLNPGETKFYTFPNTALYSPVPYIPQALGITIGRVLQLSPLAVFYLARLFNFIAWLLIVFMAVKIMPLKKWLFLILVLTPMSVHIAGSVSADALLNAVSFLFIALIFKIAYNEKTKLTIRNVFLLTLLAVIIAFSKNIYFLLVGLFFIIPCHKSGTKQQHLKNAILLFGATILAFVVSSLIVSHLMNHIDPIENFYHAADAPAINPGEQIHHILSDIPGFLIIAIKSFVVNRKMLFGSFIGKLGWLEVDFNNFFYLFYYLVILFMAVFSRQKRNLIKFSNKTIFLLIITSILLAFSFTMYCSWCEPGSSLITNLQGRYFIPVAFLVPLLLANNKFIIRKQTVFPAVTIMFIVISFGLTVFELAERYWYFKL